MTYQPSTTALVYKTFIADAYVDLSYDVAFGCGQGFHPWRKFGGDNRSWSWPNATTPGEPVHYRTMLFANVNWNNAAPYDVVINGGIGPTKLYESDNTLVETRTATLEGVEITDTFKSDVYAQTRWKHKVGNPFCAAGAITYDLTLAFYRSGTIMMTGERAPVPHHEAYGRWDNGSGQFWQTLMRRDNQGFHCLLGICASDSIYVNETR